MSEPASCGKMRLKTRMWFKFVRPAHDLACLPCAGRLSARQNVNSPACTPAMNAVHSSPVKERAGFSGRLESRTRYVSASIFATSTQVLLPQKLLFCHAGMLTLFISGLSTDPTRAGVPRPAVGSGLLKFPSATCVGRL